MQELFQHKNNIFIVAPYILQNNYFAYQLMHIHKISNYNT